MECLGGNGYVEETMLARLYREAPVNAIWEGSGNVMCLDVLRALSREGEAARAVLDDLVRRLRGICRARRRPRPSSGRPSMAADGEAKARAAVERLAMLAAAAALAESAPAAAEAFARTRLATPRGGTFGTADLDGARGRDCCSIGRCPPREPEPAHASARCLPRMGRPQGRQRDGATP